MRRLIAATGLLAAASVPLVAPSAHADRTAHADQTTCVRGTPTSGTGDTDVRPDDDSAAGFAALHPERIHDLATGAGVGVAVIDSGVRAGSALPRLVDGPSYVGGGAIVDGSGTLVAGLIGGVGAVTGLAPDARVISLRVSAAEPDDESPQPGDVDPADVAQAIDWAVSHRDQHDIRVINLSFGFVTSTPEISRALARAEREQIVVVAAAGDRVEPVQEPTEGPDDTPEPVPDEVLFPASEETVLAVTARDEHLVVDPGRVLLGPEVDVSAPVVGLRSMMLGGVVCDVGTATSGLATAEVSALAALLLEQDPSLTAAQVRTRIEATAQGGQRDSAADGHGMIQPHAALTAVLDIRPDGSLVGSELVGADDFRAPRPETGNDTAHVEARRRVLWWSVGGGGLVVLALLLRPLRD